MLKFLVYCKNPRSMHLIVTKCAFSPFSINSIVDELNTKKDSVDVARQMASMQAEGVPSLQSLVDIPATGGAHCATAATAIPSVVDQLCQPGAILVNVDIGLLARVIESQIAECYQVDPIKGGGELS